MWVPTNESELLHAIQQGVVRESRSFDAKAALPRPGKNKDLAKDICAMTVDGGVLLYGLGGDDPTRPDKPCPFDLAGAAERIDLVAQTGIAESPEIVIDDFYSETTPGTGYLTVLIPPSPRAPHMLTLDGDNRYWGRGETGNRILSEPEVARLYERRERWEVNRAALLDAAAAEMPFEFEEPLEQIGPMLVLVRPVITSSGLLARAAERQGAPVDHLISRVIPQLAAEHDAFRDQGNSGLDRAVAVTPRGAGRWFVSAAENLSFPYQALLDIRTTGEMRYWNSPTIHGNSRRGGEQQLLLERSVARAVVQTLAAARGLYELAGYHGALDIGVAILHIEQAYGASFSGGSYFESPAYGAPDYRHHDRFTLQELRDLPTVTRRLLGPLFSAISTPNFDVFETARA